MNTYHTTNKLEALTSKGLKKFWVGYAVSDGENCYTRSESWQLKANGTESKHILSAPNISTTKNVGRSNEVQPREQAILEINASLEKKRDTGYVFEGEPLDAGRPQAMTAHRFDDRKHKLKYPLISQPKLDGTRMLFDGEIGWSRNDKNYISECIAHLKCKLPSGMILDGELMLDQNDFTFQESISAIKKFRPGTSDKLQYHVYDLIDMNRPDLPFYDRYNELTSFISHMALPFIKLVECDFIAVESDIQAQHDKYVEVGYEGLMLRNVRGEYALGNRSVDLQKFKVFFDEEFTIIDAIEGDGKYAGCVTWIVETADKVEVKVTPKGTIEQKQKWWNQRTKEFGKPLTVRHFGYTDDGSLRFPVGVSIRDYE